MTLRGPPSRRRPFSAVVSLARPAMEMTIEDSCFHTLCSYLVSKWGERWRVMPGSRDTISVITSMRPTSAMGTLWMTTWTTWITFWRLVADERMVRMVSSSCCLDWRSVSDAVVVTEMS